MGLYNILIKPIVRRMNIESASKIALRYFEIVEKIPGGRLISRWIHNNRPVGLQREVFGLQFYNPLGLGAGLDLHGELYNDLNNLGFSYSEIGPLGADGIRRALRRVQNDPQNDILAACINQDFSTAFTLAYDFFDFFVIDLNDNNLEEVLDPILDARMAEEEYKPIIIKLPRDISAAEIEEILDFSLLSGVDGVEARDIEQVRHIAAYTHGKLPIIGNTHIRTPQQAEEALNEGASLLALRNGLVREGPQIVSDILKYLLSRQKNEKNSSRTSRRAAKS
jgi:Dihydroorotate dehydrogenase